MRLWFLQLLACCSDKLSEDLGNLFGDKLDKMDEAQLIAEMQKLAVVSQNNLVNIVRLRALVQDRDEPVRSFVARLKGTAGVCKLTVWCPCDPGADDADKEILYCLVNGFADKDIRNQVMGKVVEMDLEETGKFIKAKESGRKALGCT